MKKTWGRFSVVLGTFILFSYLLSTTGCKKYNNTDSKIHMDQWNTTVKDSIVTLSAYMYYERNDVEFYITNNPSNINMPGFAGSDYSVVQAADTVIKVTLNGEQAFYYRAKLNLNNLPPDVKVEYNKLYMVRAMYFGGEGAYIFSEEMLPVLVTSPATGR